MKANEIRRGTVIIYNKAPHRVMTFRHHTPGNLRAMVQTKLRNLLTGTQTEVRFGSTEEVERADVTTFPATYLYGDTSGYNFMRTDNYEEVVIPGDVLGDGVYYLQEQMEVMVTFFAGQAIGIELPSTVVLTVVETEPELKGATQGSSSKPAKMETGLTVSVPPFVKQGDKITVNTENGEYLGRA